MLPDEADMATVCECNTDNTGGPRPFQSTSSVQLKTEGFRFIHHAAPAFPFVSNSCSICPSYRVLHYTILCIHFSF
jgi:hypothetical protein